MSFPNLYNSMIPSKDLAYTYEQTQDLVLAALKPMGPDYQANLKKGMDPRNGWVDVYPNAKKDGGAYMSGEAYGVHPYVLLNFVGTYDDVSTAAHEYGHAMHSWYSNANQPYIYADYPIFLAEIASTTNEELLLTYMLSQAKDPETRLMLLGERMEGMRQTIFRQTLFAEFELRVHEVGEKGEPLTPEVVNGIYKGLIQKYYGPDYVMGPDDEVEWAFIPHFYYNYYVFTYATGLCSAISLGKQIGQKGKAGSTAAQRYLDSFLKAGGSAPPMEILKSAGVNLETAKPILDALDVFEQTVDEFDALWTRTYGKKK
jgi:oligoendopeptidase F